MPLYFDTPGLRFDAGYHWDQVEDFPHKPGSAPTTFLPNLHPQHRAHSHRMNDRQRNQLNRLINVKQFCVDHTPDFTNTPIKPGDAKFGTAKTALTALIPQITAHQSTQASGSYGQASMNQAVERQELVDLMRAVNRTANAIAIDQNQPGIMDRFRMPPLSNDALLVATGQAFATAITELNLAAEFTEHGYEGDIVADLNAEALDVQEAESEQGGALQNRGGATASLPSLLKQGANLVRCLDAVVKNRFRNSPETLGAWKIASHVMSTGGSAVPVVPPTPPATPPAG